MWQTDTQKLASSVAPENQQQEVSLNSIASRCSDLLRQDGNQKSIKEEIKSEKRQQSSVGAYKLLCKDIRPLFYTIEGPKHRRATFLMARELV